MEGASLRILAVLCLSLGIACATSTEISFDDREDFSRYRTWDWYSGAARTIGAPTSDLAGLDRDLLGLVEREFERRGFERSRREPDLRIGVLLNVRREQVTAYETGAVQHLASYHHSQSYQVQSTVQRSRTYERSRLVIFAIDARRPRLVWKGVMEDLFRGQFSPHLQRTISSLMERFPSAGHAATDRPPAPRDPATGNPSEFAGPPSRPSLESSSWAAK